MVNVVIVKTYREDNGRVEVEERCSAGSYRLKRLFKIVVVEVLRKILMRVKRWVVVMEMVAKRRVRVKN